MSQDVVADLEGILQSKSLAVIGASNSPHNFGRFFMEALLEMGYEGLCPINPAGGEVLGFKAYRSVKEIPGEVDLALMATPPETVVDLVAQCAEKGLKGIVIFTAGFGEKGERGRRLEEEIRGIARRNNTRVIGPNCVGFYCPSSRLTFFPGLPRESGPVGMISQSGSVATHFVFAASSLGLRFSKVGNFGNECDLSTVDFLQYLGEDPETRIIVAYMEGVREGRRFYQLCRAISPRKPILLWKSVSTNSGARAATSHTGVLAGSPRLWGALLSQTGVIAVESAEELLDCLLAFYHLPWPLGRRVVVVSGPGGFAVGTTNACSEFGLSLAQLSPRTKEAVSRIVPPVGTSTANPVDLGMRTVLVPEMYLEAIEILGKDDNVDLIFAFGNGVPFSRAMVEAKGRVARPLIVATFPEMGFDEDLRLLLEEGIPAYPDPRRAARALGRLVAYSDFLRGGDL